MHLQRAPSTLEAAHGHASDLKEQVECHAPQLLASERASQRENRPPVGSGDENVKKTAEKNGNDVLREPAGANLSPLYPSPSKGKVQGKEAGMICIG